MAGLSQRVLITGATGGIGEAIARRFGADGAALVLSGRRIGQLERLAGELDAQTIAADLSVRAEVTRLAATAGTVDILIANAALPGTGLVADMTQESIDTILEVNLRAPIALARALLPGMLERGRGHIVFVSSLSGKVASPAASLYNATKFGLRGFALGLREDLAGRGVSASVILPGFISDAGMFHDAGITLPRGVGTRTPEQVADAALRAVRRDRAEVIVAPLALRLGSDLAAIAPGLSAWVQRRAGGTGIAYDLAEAQTGRRPGG
ncbi:SDR family oxidoreductase [Conexibacter sp. DBS9H8]|uniref:SDR family NAD(P)-dependent oxidoreductase n=1 Tax=Conexibacter sp. DBS9H8 TaxID=2937801 RepID=UPI00200D5FD7|nr:SDR family NAD(P)-dependent oxidoreductase [Conexibacter sp. DBS9H8]